MRLFRRRLGPRDQALLGHMTAAGADLSVERHVLHYLWFDSAEDAHAAEAEAVAAGWETDVRAPFEKVPRWALVCERHAATDEAFVAASSAFFGDVASPHGGVHDGWEAAL